MEGFEILDKNEAQENRYWVDASQLRGYRTGEDRGTPAELPAK